jgi:hypothetical protein
MAINNLVRSVSAVDGQIDSDWGSFWFKGQRVHKTRREP